jgi:hypothetical protein
LHDVQTLIMRGYTRRVPYHPNMAYILVNMGSYQVSQMDSIQLIYHLSPLWSRDGDQRHTFHKPTGEITITLQDVAILWFCPLAVSQWLDWVKRIGVRSLKVEIGRDGSDSGKFDKKNYRITGRFWVDLIRDGFRVELYRVFSGFESFRVGSGWVLSFSNSGHFEFWVIQVQIGSDSFLWYFFSDRVEFEVWLDFGSSYFKKNQKFILANVRSRLSIWLFK